MFEQPTRVFKLLSDSLSTLPVINYENRKIISRSTGYCRNITHSSKMKISQGQCHETLLFHYIIKIINNNINPIISNISITILTFRKHNLLVRYWGKRVKVGE